MRWASRVRGRRWTIRLRLTLLYGGLFLTAGALLLAVTYVLVAYALPLLPVEAPPAPELGGPFVPPPTPSVPDLSDQLGRQRAHDLRQFLAASGIALVIMAFVSAWLGWLVSGRALRPLRSMTGTVREISARNLHQRLDRRGPNDEIKDLADTFDGLLGRLEAAFEAQRGFVANASHELRTPLTFERSLLEIALANSDASAAELRATCRRVLAGNQHQERLIEALLTLARSQRGLDRREPLDLSEIAAALLDPAQEPPVEADLNPAPATGDPRLVERLVANLLDNAVRHNIPGGHVKAWTGTDAGRPTVRVTNTGPIIPPDQVDALFEPFRRLDATRTSGRDGLGLGLSIVAAVAAAHEAELSAHPLPQGGLDVKVAF